MRALILVGGRGKRLHGQLGSTPKALFAAGGRPLLGFAQSTAELLGATETVIFTGGDVSLRDTIEAYLTTTTQSIPVTLTGGDSRSTAEAVWLSRRYLSEPFLYLHGNVIPSPAALERFRSAVDRSPSAVVALGSRLDHAPTHPHLRATGEDLTAIEIPVPGSESDGPPFCSLECYYCPKGTLEALESSPTVPTEMFASAMARMIASGHPGVLVDHPEDWFHLATPEDLQRDVEHVVRPWNHPAVES